MIPIQQWIVDPEKKEEVEFTPPVNTLFMLGDYFPWSNEEDEEIGRD